MSMTNVALENAEMKVVVRPDFGGRIDSIFDKRSEKEWLWHPANYKGETRELKVGSSFDNNWTGGWDEVFPNDAPGPFHEHNLVDHGELWSQNWKVIEKNHFGIKMEYQCSTVPVRVEKTIIISNFESKAHIRYMFFNQSQKEIPFLFKMHAALAIEEGDKLVLPDCHVEPVDLGFSTWIGKKIKTPFPAALDENGFEIDLSQVPAPTAKKKEFYYCSALTEGKCGLYNERTKTQLSMDFKLEHFPFIWNFQSFGGWNDHYVAVLEPATTLPWNLDEALKASTCAILQPQETQERFISFSIES